MASKIIAIKLDVRVGDEEMSSSEERAIYQKWQETRCSPVGVFATLWDPDCWVSSNYNN